MVHIEVNAHLNDVNCVRFNPNGELLASVSDDGACHIWRLSEQMNES